MKLTSNDFLMITGGTGSFGNVTLKRFLLTDYFKEIRIFSRDEKKQDDMRQHYQNQKIKYYIGDVRDKRSLDNAMQDVDYVFHAAALKQVPSCEFFPMEAVRTNVMGCENVLDSALENGVKNVVVLSTDKAVYSINAMGMSKVLSEKVMVAKSRNLKATIEVREFVRLAFNEAGIELEFKGEGINEKAYVTSCKNPLVHDNFLTI